MIDNKMQFLFEKRQKLTIVFCKLILIIGRFER